MERWSFSKIEATKGCKIAFEKRYIQELPPDTEVPEFVDAKAMHEKIEEKFLNKQIDEYNIFAPTVYYNVYAEKEYKHFFEEEEIEFIAYPDIILERDDFRLILDIKCRYDNKINERDKLQLLIYSALANKENPVKDNKIGILAVYNHYEPINAVYIEPAGLDFILTEIEKAKRRIPRMTVKTSECSFCEYKKSCEYGSETIDESNIQSVAEKYLYLKSQLEMYEEMLRKHAEMTDKKIRVGDKELGFFERVYTKVEVPEFIMLCEDNKIPYIDTIKIDTVKAKQLARKYEILTQAIGKDVKYVFTAKKVEEEKWRRKLSL